VRRDAEPVDSESLSVAWEPNDLPAGFYMTASARQMLPAGPVEHLVFSDGLASVSVFVEMGRSSAGEVSPDDAATLGTSSAFSTSVQGYRVTAVGEVPPETVRVIARAIRNAGPGSGDSESVSSSAQAAAAGPRAAPPPALATGGGPAVSASAAVSDAAIAAGTATPSGGPSASSAARGLGADTPGFGPMGGRPAGGGPGRH